MYVSIESSAEKELLSERGLTQNDFQAILQQHQSNKNIQEIFMKMQVCATCRYVNQLA